MGERLGLCFKFISVALNFKMNMEIAWIEGIQKIHDKYQILAFIKHVPNHITNRDLLFKVSVI